MPSILPNFEYDIFISYRQNDNKSGWVSSFVKALQDELEATLKNPVSIYFDENPHDGLLETHQVDASLEKKLKCLVFMPCKTPKRRHVAFTNCRKQWRFKYLSMVKDIMFSSLRENDEYQESISIAREIHLAF